MQGNSAKWTRTFGKRVASCCWAKAMQRWEVIKSRAVRLFSKNIATRSRLVETRRDFCPVLFSLRPRDGLKRESTAALFPEGLKVAPIFHLNGELHEWGNETATVPAHCLVKPQSRERARVGMRGKKTP